MERGALQTGAEILLQSMVKTMVTQVVPLQPTEDQTRADPVACGGTHTGAGALKEAAAHGKPMPEKAPGSRWKGAHTEAICF